MICKYMLCFNIISFDKKPFFDTCPSTLAMSPENDLYTKLYRKT